MGIWRKFGEYLYIGIFFLTILFGLVRDSQNPSDKETFFSVLHIQIQYLRVMELRETKLMVRGRPMDSCRWSNLWFMSAQHGVEPALTALFQRSAH